MLLSMTGHGEARIHDAGLTVAVELRTITSRFLKISVRTSDAYGALEPQLETLLRQSLRRGTIQASIRVDRVRPLDDYQINVAVLDRYRQQLEGLHRQWNVAGTISPESLLLLPGAVNADPECAADVTADWPVIARAVEIAVKNLDEMRQEEGRTMAADLTANCRLVAESLAQIKQRAPAILDSYRKRLEERVRKAMEEFQVSLDPADLVREV